MNYRIALGTDHRGFALKELLRGQSQLGGNSITWIDCGTFSQERTDYPIYAKKVVELILTQQVDLGILLCGSGVGISIAAANRFKGIFAGVAWNKELARLAKEDDNINILVIPADYIKSEELVPLVEAWLTAKFKEGRYKKRIEMIESE